MVIEESLKELYRVNYLDEHWMGIAIADKRLKVWPMRLIPKSLRDWLKVHDAHHLITGYDTGLAGEAEIAAWRKGKGEYSLHTLDSELVLVMEFDEARHYLPTGEIPADK